MIQQIISFKYHLQNAPSHTISCVCVCEIFKLWIYNHFTVLIKDVARKIAHNTFWTLQYFTDKNSKQWGKNSHKAVCTSFYAVTKKDKVF